MLWTCFLTSFGCLLKCQPSLYSQLKIPAPSYRIPNTPGFYFLPVRPMLARLFILFPLVRI